MRSIGEIAREIVGREGGFVDDPDDPGGVTNYGVTLKTLRRLGLDLNRDAKVDRQDLMDLSVDQAVDIFIIYYFDKPGIAQLPKEIQPSVFDMYVNAGGNAVRILQTLLRKMGYDITVDGILGPQSFAAARSASRVDGIALRDAYGIARRTYYFRLADRRPASRKYARSRNGGKGGWIKRAEEFISPGYRLSPEEFQQRVSKWG